MTTEKWIFLGSAIGFLIIAIILIILKLVLKSKQNKNTSTIKLDKSYRGGLAGIWSFTKEHFLTFSILICFVFAGSCILIIVVSK
ncbi:hypothetical protein [Spiroplasma turonicum]|uniref:Uncharacterized protein n=1 Tax=Spiroplasma turonicum TaxID=216946 RepID=A0A0K1P760_9MOLU|nr:hypothetical protein [Spiroplasma turonicum]AKU80034.1 hypothetical protein STURON_00788 [Spiroplasma turonicum]ALX71036.1 hypothetical protein STURO_v1c07850 [Spiroplasma turonicum]